MPRPNIKVMDKAKDNDSGYKSLAAAILGQAVQDYAFPHVYDKSGSNGKGNAQYNRKKLEEFFSLEWCEELCDAVDFPRNILLNKGMLVTAGRRIKGKRKRSGPVLHTGGV